MRRILKTLGRSFLVLLAIFLAVCTAGEVHQRILVHRASALLADMHSLPVHQSNWTDAQRLMSRWGKWGHFDGTCTSDDCFYVMTLDDLTVPASNNIAEWRSRAEVIISAFRLLPRQFAGGLRQMQAMFLVQNGVVVRSGISIDMTVSPFAKNVQGSCCGDELIMSVRSQSSLDLPEDSWDEQRRSPHPDYTVWRPGGCTFCLMGRVTYADNMPSSEAAKLSDFQLSCATRWSSCLTLEELDPAAHAWHLYATPWGDPPEENARPAMPTTCTLPLYSLGRDASRIVSVEALEDGALLGDHDDGVENEGSRIKVLSVLKGASPWAIDSIQKVVSSGFTYDDKVRKPVHFLKTRHYLLMLGKQVHGVQNASFSSCGIIEDNAANAAEIHRGVAMDRSLRGFEPSASLGGFERRSPEPWNH